MTTINVAVLDTCTLVATDGLATGRHPQKIAKMTPLPHLRAIIACRGPCEITTQLPLLACRFETLLEIRDALPALLRKKYGFAKRVMPKFFNFDMVLAGYHDGASVAFSIGSKTWEVEGIKDGSVSPGVDLSNLPYSGRTQESSALIKIREVMRRQRAQFGDVGCGGFAQITTISPNGTITTRKLCDF